MTFRANGRVHLHVGAQALVAFRRSQREVVGCDFDGGVLLVIAQERHLFSGRDVQDVNALAVLLGQAHQPRRRDHRRFFVAPYRVRSGIARLALTHARDQACLVLRMEGRPP